MTNRVQNNGGVSSFMTGLLVGSLAAAATTLLITPKSGRETRDQLLQSGIDLGNDVLESADNAVSQVLKKGRALSSDMYDRMYGITRRSQNLVDKQHEYLSAVTATEDNKVRVGAK